jgi:hypothetical protein
MSANEVINKLVTRLDSNTREFPLTKSLDLVGDLTKSPFLRAVARKCEQFGIDWFEVYPNSTRFLPSSCTLFDRETCGKPFMLVPHEDIDKTQYPGMSCVAEAVYLLLKELNLISGKNITIVGRGHSVKGLAEKLIENDATVTVAHSKTESLLMSTMSKDVVIYATPEITKSIAYDTKELVIDVGNCITHPSWFYANYMNGRDIGKLTVSVLLNRLVR